MINILFSGNDKVFDGVLTTMLSIVKRTKTDRPFNVYVYTMDLTRLKPDYKSVSNSQIDFLDKVLKSYNAQSKVTKVDVTDLYEREFGFGPNESAYCSPYTLIRLLADLVEGMPDKILYLDVDVMFNRDITLLYDIDVTDYEYAAARDHYGKFLIRPNYINAGVLLFNMKKMRETEILKKAREKLKNKKLVFADQDALYWSTTKKKMLAQKFNDQKFLHPKSTIVRHFSKRLFWLPYPHTDNIKQWHVDKVHKVFGYHIFDDVFDEYLKLKAEFENKS